jgi:cytochrome P450
MLTADPPTHTRLRKLVSMAFTRRQVERLKPGIEAICAALLDDVAKELDTTGEADLVSSFAYPLPLTVICDLLGIPPESRTNVRTWIGPVLAGGIAGFEAYATAARKLVTFLQELVAAKRRNPADDLLSALLQARDGEDGLSEDELTSMVQLLFVAGHDTTVSLIANGVLALLSNPAQLASLRADPERWPAAIEELLRFDSPVQVAICRRRRTGGDRGSGHSGRGRRDRVAAGGEPGSGAFPRPGAAGPHACRRRPPQLRARHPPLSRRAARPTGRTNRAAVVR